MPAFVNWTIIAYPPHSVCKFAARSTSLARYTFVKATTLIIKDQTCWSVHCHFTTLVSTR